MQILDLDQTQWLGSEASLTELSPNFKAWFCHTGSMTQKMREQAKTIRVDVQTETYRSLSCEESRLLNHSQERDAFIREVLIHCDDQICLWARSVLSCQHSPRLFKAISALGNKALGSILFSDPTITRSPFEWGRLPENANEFEMTCWGRRSVFSDPNESLCLTEIFLPPFHKSIDTWTAS